jgi:hypothetical protein
MARSYGSRVTWSDNLCTVGSTCIHGWFAPDEMRRLLAECPDGTFTPTFYIEHDKGGPVTSPEALERYLASRRVSYMAQRSAPFYFNFPRDAAGERLLQALGLLQAP